MKGFRDAFHVLDTDFFCLQETRMHKERTIVHCG